MNGLWATLGCWYELTGIALALTITAAVIVDRDGVRR